MAQYRDALPQLQSTRLFLTDGGLETTLVFHDGIELPDFAAFTLMADAAGRETLRRYYERYLEIAERHRTGFILESPTWRASSDWGHRRGFTDAELAALNRASIELLEALRATYAPRLGAPLVISGCIGPRGDGYVPGHRMSSEDAERYHLAQIRTFATTSADFVTAITMNYTDEAIGITRAARRVGLPCAISFTVETDGRLPSGESLVEAITRVDAQTDGYPAYFMINCAHPSHFVDALIPDDPSMRRIRGIRANASHRSHAELDAATSLDSGHPKTLAYDHLALLTRLPHLHLLGGCCGTDHRHVEAIAEVTAPMFEEPDSAGERAAVLALGTLTLALAALLTDWFSTALELARWT